MLSKKVTLHCAGILLIALIGTVSLSLFRFTDAPDVTFKYIDGRKVNIRHLESKAVLVTFWATSCPGCMKEMPHLIALYNSLSKQGLEVIGVAMAYDPPNRVLAMAQDRKIPYPIALDIDGAIARAYNGVSFTPTTYLLAPGGKIISRTAGPLDMVKLRKEISGLLAQKQATKSMALPSTL